MTRLLEWLPWLSPGALAAGALASALYVRRAWQILGGSTAIALVSAATTTVAALLARDAMASPPGGVAEAQVATLVAFLGWTIGDYARRYLEGEAGQLRFVVAFLATLASVSAVVASENFGLLVAAWIVSSATLHQLLTFYRDRPAALVVAHKKFLASRLAEACLLGAAALLYRQWGTLDLASLDRLAAAAHTLPPAAAVATVLIATAVILKSAQLPLHGWLIQVMEAPTPVSALLHAGVVNLGGYVLLRVAPLVAASPAAQALLGAVGSLTALLAGLVMMTRVTIKVRLAWSTCSQMGFMLMECGLGLYDLALLHLLAHALYKAHAFLTAGEAVRESLRRTLIGPPPAAASPRSGWIPVIALAAAGAVVSGSAVLWCKLLHLPAASWLACALLACGLATLLWAPADRPSGYLRRLGFVLGATQIYLAWHGLFGAPLGISEAPASPVLAGGVLLCFLSLYLGQWWLPAGARNTLPDKMYHWVYAGFYLDERFTRLTFRLWPLPRAQRTADGTHDFLPGNDRRTA